MNDNQVMHAMLIDDAYRVEQVLAHGACGLTELVSIEGAGPFVRKKIPLELARRRVWSALSECTCSRLPHVEATYELPDCFVVVYDFIPGRSLQSVLDKDGVLSVSSAVACAQQVCEAAEALHEQCVIHRDITPGNIVLSSDGAHLVDLGIARIRVDDAVRDTASLGTWGFASPEQFGFAQSDARSDVYSIGRVLGCSLTGLRPDEDGYDEALADEGKVPVALKRIIDKACAFEPSMRYQSAAEMAKALLRISDGCSGSGDEAFGGRTVRPEKPLLRLSTDDNASKDESGASSSKTASAVGVSDERVAKGDSAGSSILAASSVSIEPEGHNSTRKRRRLVMVAALVVVVLLLVSCGFAYGHFVVGSSGGSADAASTSREDAPSDDKVSSGWESSSFGSEDEAISSGDVGTNAQKATSLLEIEETGWTRARNGYVNYVYALRNTSESSSVLMPSVHVVARSKKGKSLATETEGAFVIGPGQTIYQGGTMKTLEKPSALDVDVVDSSSAEVVKGDLANEYSFGRVSSRKDDLGGVLFVGDVSTSGAKDYGDWDGGVRVTVVLRGKGGKLMGCEEAYVEGLKDGGSTSFETLSTELDGYSSYEAYAEDWA